MSQVNPSPNARRSAPPATAHHMLALITALALALFAAGWWRGARVSRS